MAGVEDPRINLQSILSRHFLVWQLVGTRFDSLMRQEYRFAAVMDWLFRIAKLDRDLEGRAVTLDALRKGSDNAEGLEIPSFVLQSFTELRRELGESRIPNYLEAFLHPDISEAQGPSSAEGVLNTFLTIWHQVLMGGPGPGLLASGQAPPSGRISVLEPACGSANDYRFLHSYGVAAFCDYTGFDLCLKNIQNAKTLFPEGRFEQGNVFEIPAADKQFDVCIIHDLFEHLSLEGLEQAVSEICRVTRTGICAGFFQMDEIPDHVVRPLENYYWNLLSVEKTKRIFVEQGFEARVVHIGGFLSAEFGCRETHNENAYTFFLKAL